MKKLVALFIAILLLPPLAKTQSTPSTLDVISWNVEFFGAPYNSGPSDKDLQEVNVKRLMRYFNADLYGLLEVVDTMRLRRLVDSLGNTEFAYVVAPYCSNNTTGTGASWTSGQKQAFIYRKSLFSNVTTRGIMRNSSGAYTNWASGRFPYLLSATVTIDGISKNLNFILLHGKSGSTVDDFNKRQAAANELKDTLDAFFSTANTYIIGDFNDALNTSIYTGSSVSSYNSIVADSTDADHYKSVTLPLGAAGQTTMINFPNVIDNHIISNEVEAFYVLGSAQIRTDVTTIIPNYVTAHNTSDHYPVFSKYSLAGIITGLPTVTPAEMGIMISPNPFNDHLLIRPSKNMNNLQINLYNAGGQLIRRFSLGFTAAGSTITQPLPPLPKGIYYLQAETKQYRSVLKMIH
ncbi:MAG TPA: T9SS type A sorting domain-containing protein [Chitinophagaceae bacterium]|nr:T9SS type A sorting domain-containing protein [Chitinophagaceae bacterium]